MKKLFVFLLWALICPQFVLAPAYAQGPQRICYTTDGQNCVPAVQSSNSVKIDNAAATTTQIIALVSGKTIFLTSWNVIAAGTGNFSLSYGTGTNCGTGTTALTGPYPLIAQAGITVGNGIGPVLIVPRGNALCVTASTSVQFSGSVSYAQF